MVPASPKSPDDPANFGRADRADDAGTAERADRPAGAAGPASLENAAEHRRLRRVVFLMNDMHRPNGIVSATDLLATEMRARGLAVDIWCFGACDPELRERHHVIDVVPGRRLTTKMPGFANSKAALKPIRHLITLSWWPWTAARLRRLASRWEEETLVIGAGLESVRLLDQAGVHPAHLVSQVHTDVPALTTVQRALVRGAATVSAAVTALTPQGADELRSWGINAVPMTNPCPDFAGAADPERSRTVVFLGRLSEGKQADHLIRAFGAVSRPDWRLRIYGSGPQEGRLRKLAASTGGDIELCGSVDDVGPVLAGAAIHALPSRFEGLGMCILEANTAGVPSVVYDCSPGVRLAGGPAASLVPNGDVDAFATALGTLMDDAAARADAGRRAREYGRRFSAPAIVDRWLELWDDLAVRPEAR